LLLLQGRRQALNDPQLHQDVVTEGENGVSPRLSRREVA
jgi:hypothetical protein